MSCSEELPAGGCLLNETKIVPFPLTHPFTVIGGGELLLFFEAPLKVIVSFELDDKEKFPLIVREELPERQRYVLRLRLPWNTIDCPGWRVIGVVAV